ncbi:hypothetical protein VTG60DRAFT_5398 [Thermothelomyces hinnuleus]
MYMVGLSTSACCESVQLEPKGLLFFSSPDWRLHGAERFQPPYGPMRNDKCGEMRVIVVWDASAIREAPASAGQSMVELTGFDFRSKRARPGTEEGGNVPTLFRAQVVAQRVDLPSDPCTRVTPRIARGITPCLKMRGRQPLGFGFFGDRTEA